METCYIGVDASYNNTGLCFMYGDSADLVLITSENKRPAVGAKVVRYARPDICASDTYCEQYAKKVLSAKMMSEVLVQEIIAHRARHGYFEMRIGIEANIPNIMNKKQLFSVCDMTALNAVACAALMGIAPLTPLPIPTIKRLFGIKPPEGIKDADPKLCIKRRFEEICPDFIFKGKADDLMDAYAIAHIMREYAGCPPTGADKKPAAKKIRKKTAE